jgi:hypothetical protein
MPLPESAGKRTVYRLIQTEEHCRKISVRMRKTNLLKKIRKKLDTVMMNVVQ